LWGGKRKEEGLAGREWNRREREREREVGVSYRHTTGKKHLLLNSFISSLLT
jgi:hypothetical protein